MKVIEIPEEAITILDDKESADGKAKVVTFSDFLIKGMDNYVPDKPSIGQLRQANRVCNSVESINGDKSLSLEDSDYALLKAAVERSVGIWAPKCARRLLPYFDAVEKAHDVTPN